MSLIYVSAPRSTHVTPAIRAGTASAGLLLLASALAACRPVPSNPPSDNALEETPYAGQPRSLREGAAIFPGIKTCVYGVMEGGAFGKEGVDRISVDKWILCGSPPADPKYLLRLDAAGLDAQGAVAARFAVSVDANDGVAITANWTRGFTDTFSASGPIAAPGGFEPPFGHTGGDKFSLAKLILQSAKKAQLSAAPLPKGASLEGVQTIYDANCAADIMAVVPSFLCKAILASKGQIAGGCAAYAPLEGNWRCKLKDARTRCQATTIQPTKVIQPGETCQ